MAPVVSAPAPEDHRHDGCRTVATDFVDAPHPHLSLRVQRHGSSVTIRRTAYVGDDRLAAEVVIPADQVRALIRVLGELVPEASVEREAVLA